MSNNEFLTDDFVAGLLAQEANDCSLKYSALGMEAFVQKKRPENVPKPNKRFLRHIIKNTDTHNKALLAKETSESKARLQNLEHTQEVKRRKTNPTTRDIRTRQMGDIQAILGGKKVKPDSVEERSQQSGSSKRPKMINKDAATRSPCNDREFRRRKRDCPRDSLVNSDRSSNAHRTKDDDCRQARRKSTDKSKSEAYQTALSKREKQGSRSKSDRRSRSPDRSCRSSQYRHRSPSAEEDLVTKRRPKGEDTDDSDPLEDLIGPARPAAHRGRGAIGKASGIDRRFSESYDPKTDLQLENDDSNGWDDALEAYRDHKKLRLKREERLRAAGFAEHTIRKTLASASVSEPASHVVWSKSGQDREWDEGKSATFA